MVILKMLIGLLSGRRSRNLPRYYLSAGEAQKRPAWPEQPPRIGPWRQPCYGLGGEQVGDLGERFSVSHTPPWEGEAAACLEMVAGIGRGSSRFTPLVQWGQDMQSQGGPERHLHSGFQGGWMSREDVWRADTQRGLASQPGCNSPSTELDS